MAIQLFEFFRQLGRGIGRFGRLRGRQVILHNQRTGPRGGFFAIGLAHAALQIGFYGLHFGGQIGYFLGRKRHIQRGGIHRVFNVQRLAALLGAQVVLFGLFHIVGHIGLPGRANGNGLFICGGFPAAGH